MASRRMFAKSVINKTAFLRLPVEAHALYFHLALNADDDGIVEAFAVMRLTDAKESYLSELEEGGFIKILNSDLVVFIVHWRIHNNVRRDQYKPSMYQSLLIEHKIDYTI